MWLVSSFALSVLSLVCSLMGAWLSVRRANRVVESPRAKLRSVESRLESAEDSLSELRDLVKTATESLKMQRVRKASRHASSPDLPDPYTEPEAWRKAMNIRLISGKLGQK
jgi:hypothetical protein